jgi:hypothetical protein
LTQGANTKNSKLQGASKKKKITRGGKQNSLTLQRDINLFTLKKMTIEFESENSLKIWSHQRPTR